MYKIYHRITFIENFSSLLVDSIREQEMEHERLKGLENEFTHGIRLDEAIKKQWAEVYHQKGLLKKIYELGTQIKNQDY